MLETFFRNHAYLLEHYNAPIRRALMDNIDWSYRLIGIRGPRGVGRTSFLLQYAKENFDPHLRQCLYINLNNFYFQGRGLVDFAGEFVRIGGQVLLADQVFKLDDWREQLCECYRKYPLLRIVYTTTSVERPDAAGSPLSQIARTYVLHGFSFREYVNLKTGNSFQPFSLDQVLADHEQLARAITQRIDPRELFQDYLRFGYYPFFLENHNFIEALLKAMNQMIEVDLLFNKQVELKYLSRLKRLLYMLAVSGGEAPNVSRMAKTICTSRATVMNYLKYLEEARLINMVYREGESFPKKPAAVMLHDTNLIHAVYSPSMSEQYVMETFFVNTLWRHHTVNRLRRDGFYKVNGTTEICVCDRQRRTKAGAPTVFARYNSTICRGNEIPLWLFGFLY